MPDDSYCFDDGSMLQFLYDFDPIAEKYGIYDVRDQIAAEQMTRLYQYDSMLQNPVRKNPPYGDIYDNLNLVYGTSEPIREYLDIYNLVHDKLIAQFLGIKGLDQLYGAQYFNFEWEMHLGLDYTRHTQSHYRDHFIHQVKNAHEVYIMLRKFSFMERIKKVVNQDDTLMSGYLKRAVEQSAVEISANQTLKAFYRKAFHLKEDMGGGDAIDLEALRKQNEQFQSCTMEYIVMGASIMAALFHDIGYPIAHALRNREGIEQFLPTVYYFLSGSEHFDRIRALLCNSLLFMLVPQAEIQKRFYQKDHGTFSALAFLLSFYENGAIFHLTTAQSTAVELAALVIYNHTLSYTFTPYENPSDSKRSDYYHPVFYRNPISYLFRVCDDMQEWGRTYFHLSDRSDLQICSRCGLPILNQAGGGTGGHFRYVCGCTDWNKAPDGTTGLSCLLKPETTTRYVLDDVRYRKLFHIKTCDRLTLRWEKPPAENADGVLLMQIEYDPQRLLQMARIDPSFAGRRAEDLNKLRALLCLQKAFPVVIINSFITTNPIALKLKILEDWIARVADGDYDNEGATNPVVELGETDVALVRRIVAPGKSVPLSGAERTRQIVRLLHRLAVIVYGDQSIDYFEKRGQRMAVYGALASFGVRCRTVGFREPVKILKMAPVATYASNNHSDCLDYLIRDYCVQCSRSLNYKDTFDQTKHFPPDYFKQFSYMELENPAALSKAVRAEAEAQRFISAVKMYTQEENSGYAPNARGTLDFYTDYMLFDTLSRSHQHRKPG